MQLGYIVSWASKAALLVPPAVGLLPLELGREGMVLTYTWKQMQGKGGRGEDEETERKGARSESTGVLLCPWERCVDMGSRHPWEL